MTEHARVVLQDCKHAIEKHTQDLQAEDFRISWISIVTLLRAIGHVLDKVDANQSPAMRKAIDEKYKELKKNEPEPRIFWSFIEEERNRFLKEYKHGVVRTINLKTKNPNLYVSLDLANSRGGKIIGLRKYDKSYISSGEFKGKNELEIAWFAYDWWKKYLDEIDSFARQYQNKK